MVTTLSGLFVCATVILLAGRQLSKYGDLLAEKTGIGKAFIGLFLMSAVTSLPELMTGFSSAAIIQSADLATGDILGSCAFNLFLLSVMELFLNQRSPLLSTVSQSHTFAASLSTVLVALVGLGIFLQTDIVILPFIGLNSLLFLIVYFVALRIIYRYQQLHPIVTSQQDKLKSVLTTRQVISRYALFAVITIGAALFLPYFADRLAEQTGLGKSFVGAVFLAISTSLPEIAVSIAAVRMNSTDLAVGNILGSNIFNVFILFLDDVFYTKGHLLKDASDSNLITVFSVIIMSAITIISITYRSPDKKYFLGWDTLLILIVYIFNMILLYHATAD